MIRLPWTILTAALVGVLPIPARAQARSNYEELQTFSTVLNFIQLRVRWGPDARDELRLRHDPLLAAARERFRHLGDLLASPTK